MADEFDTQAAKRRRMEIIEAAQEIRFALTKEVINFNYDKVPRSEAEEQEMRADMRKWLTAIVRRIDDLLKKL